MDAERYRHGRRKAVKEAGYLVELRYETEGGKPRVYKVPPSKVNEIRKIAKKKGWYWTSERFVKPGDHSK